MAFEYIEKGAGDITIFVFHFMTGTKDSMGFLLNQDNVRYVFPEGKYETGHNLGGKSWYIGELEFYDSWSNARQAEAILDTAHEMAAFMKKIAPSGKRIVTGMSQGGDLSIMLAVHYPELIHAALPAAGRLFPPSNFDAKGQALPPVHLYQGEVDENVPVELAQNAHTWLQNHDYTTTLTIYPDVGHDYSMEMIEDIRDKVRELTSD